MAKKTEKNAKAANAANAAKVAGAVGAKGGLLGTIITLSVIAVVAVAAVVTTLVMRKNKEKEVYVPMELELVSSENYYGTGNEDCYAWIQIPELGVSFPILQNPDDDEYYKTHDAFGNESANGALYTQASFNGKDFTDTWTTIYGSSTDENDLFGKLQAFFTDDANFADMKKREIHITVNGKDEVWIIFAATPYSPSHLQYYYDFENARVYKSFFDYLAATRSLESKLDTELFPETGEQILCLCTSMKEDPTRVFAVFARRLEAINHTLEKNPGVEEAKEQWNFTPSAKGKSAPSVKEMTTKDGQKISNTYKTGEKLKDEVKDYVVITAAKDRADAPDEAITKRLDAAYNGMQDTSSLGALASTDKDEKDITLDLEAILKDLNAKVSVDNLVARDLFDITPFGKYRALLGQNDQTVDLTFDVNVGVDETFIVMESPDGEAWTVIPNEFVMRNEDNSIKVTLNDLGVIAFVAEAKSAEEITVNSDTVLSPVVKRAGE